MKYCKECGTPVEDLQTECRQCGTKITVTPSPSKSFTIPKFNLDKKMKIILASAAALVVVVFVGYQVGAALTDKDKIIVKFQKAIVEEDKKTVAGLLSSTDPRLVIDEKAADSLIKYIKKNPSYLSQMMNAISNQSKQLADSNKIAASSSTINLTKNGKTLGLYDRYVFEVKPYFINVKSSLDKTKILFDGNEIGQIDKIEAAKEFGPFMLGNHKVKGLYQGEFATIEKEQDLELLQSEKSNVDIVFKAEYASLRSNFDDAVLFVNQKSLGPIKDNKKIGPVPMDGSIKMYAEKVFPWGKVASKEIALKDSYNVDLTVNGVTDEVKISIMNAINGFNQSNIEALTNLDASKYVNVTNEKLTELTRNVDSMKTSNQLFKGKYLKAEYDLDSFQANLRNNKYYVQVRNSESHESAYYRNGDNPRMNNNEVSWNYSVIFEDDKWKVAENSRIYYASPKNRKIFDFK
jgi:uncharacterized membrane protein YvbJ